MASECDVLVIGAGPAGSSAAKIASEKGLNVIVLEKDSLDREKPCGGFVSKRVFEEFEIPDSVIDRKCRGLFLCSPSNKTVSFESDYAGALVMRSIFDKALCDLAREKGAEFRENTKFIEPLLDGGKVVGVKAETDSGVKEFHSKIVVAADGTPSLFASKLGLQSNDSRLEAACVQYLMSLPEEDIVRVFDDKIELYFGDNIAPGAYAWIFPRKDVLSVGLGCTLDVIQKNKLDLNQRLKDFVEKHSIASGKLKEANIMEKQGHMIGFPGILKQIYGDGFLICGDAAGFVEYSTAEGIYYSLRSGQIAGETAAKALQAGDTSKNSLRRYERETSRAIGGELKESFWTKKLFFSTEKKQEKLVEFSQKDKNFKNLLSDFMFEYLTTNNLIKRIIAYPTILIKLFRFMY